MPEKNRFKWTIMKGKERQKKNYKLNYLINMFKSKLILKKDR